MSTTELMMLDSGAFSVWSKGLSIDINDYIDFCKRHPKVSYYVCLDVIPGTLANRKVSLQMREQAAEQSYQNYLKMVESLPQEKVIPVYHRGEDVSWVNRYLDHGCTYLGFGGLVGGSGGKELPIARAFDVAKKYPDAKVHGFGVTSFRLMVIFPWYSVDSSSWLKQASYGGIWLPRWNGDSFVYDTQPAVLNMSPKSPSVDVKGLHYFSLSPNVRKIYDHYFEQMKINPGEFEIVAVDEDYKKQKNELWYRKPKRYKTAKTTVGMSGFVDVPETSTKSNLGAAVLRITKRGLVTCHNMRFWVNMRFLQKLEQNIDLNHIYFAGDGIGDKVECRIKKRLMSYHYLHQKGKAYDAFCKHLEQMA